MNDKAKKLVEEGRVAGRRQMIFGDQVNEVNPYLKDSEEYAAWERGWFIGTGQVHWTIVEDPKEYFPVVTKLIDKSLGCAEEQA